MTKDPISGLVEFAQDVKPYHTKIIEVLVDYIHEETMNVSFVEGFNLNLNIDVNSHTDYCPDGYGIPPWGDYYSIALNNTVDGTIVLNSSHVFNIINIIKPNMVVVAGDQTSLIVADSVLSIVNSFANDGSWRVVSSVYVVSDDQTRVHIIYQQSEIRLKMFAAHTFKHHITSTPINMMYITGRVSDFFGVGETITLTESTHGHNGTWLVDSICDNMNFSEVNVQHVTDTTPDGVIYTDIIEDTTPTWPTGMYWFNPDVGQLNRWDGGQWTPPTTPVIVLAIEPPSPSHGDLWFKNTLPYTLKEYSDGVGDWLNVDESYWIAGSIPLPDAEGPIYNTSGPIILNTTPSFNIIGVESVSRTQVINDEYDPSEDGSGNGCATQYAILDKSEPSAIFTIEGDQQWAFNVPTTFVIATSTGNDGVWTVTSMSYDLLLNQTKIHAKFAGISTIDDDTTGSPDELFLTWDAIYGFGLGGMDLDLPLTSSVIKTQSLSNFDFPQQCSSASQTTTSAKFKEDVDFEISLPMITAPFSILQVTATSPGIKGTFEVSGNQRRFFSPNSVFVVSGSGSNDGVWTVYSVTYNLSTDSTIITTNEQIETFIHPVGNIVLEQAAFADRIGVNMFENNAPPAWEFYFDAAPTSPIIGIDTVNNRLVISGDVTRFFATNSRVTIQQSVNNIGAWQWTVVSRTYTVATNTTLIQLSGAILNSTPPFGFVSGQPTWISGIGWDHGGWSMEQDPLFEIVDTSVPPNEPLFIGAYDGFVVEQPSYDNVVFDLGGFDDILQQILPL